MIKVGIKGNTYSDVITDADGFADAKKYMPHDFDLCLLRIKDKRTQVGWISGNHWDGVRMKDGDEVLMWKKQKEESKGIYDFK